jgi:hypothetical protein
MHKVTFSSLLCALIISTPLLSLQQTKTFQLQRPDVMINQGIERFEQTLTVGRICMIVGASVCTGAALWLYAHKKQKFYEDRCRQLQAHNDRILQTNKDLLPQIVPVIISAGRQKPPTELMNGVEVNRPMGQDIAKEILSYLPNETTIKTNHTNISNVIRQTKRLSDSHYSNIKYCALSIPLITLGALSKWPDLKDWIIILNALVLTPMVNASINLAHGEIKEASKPIIFLGTVYLIIKNRHRILRFI